MVSSKSKVRDLRNQQPVSFEQGVAGLKDTLETIMRFHQKHGRWPTIREEYPLSWEIKNIVERYRRICDAHGVSLFNFILATFEPDDIVWSKMSQLGLTSVKKSGEYDGSIAEAMEIRLSSSYEELKDRAIRRLAEELSKMESTEGQNI